ncbi:CpaF family protein [Pseudoflavonifractor sp. An184]|uniref:CpaF family protein n=1 Tax=Pseudoflavonifractor sp. An184 TaxID=1965576 RepID=UPI000B550B39|nr:CpaF family protein [Pseudoflavonifractor sp. An184]OUP52249.1 pilus assembly protein [Pseudoflavonifractor sp. An184]
MTETSKNELIAQLKAEIHQNPDLTTMSDEQLRFLIQKNLEDKIDWARTNQPDVYRELSSLNFREKRFIANAVYESIRGLGVLGQIIADPEITEVMINGYRDIFVERSGRLQKLENHFESRQELETIITKFVSQSGRVVNESEPIVDTHLEDGSRVNVVMPPVALNGPIVTIRRFPREAMTVQKLISYGSITPEVAEVLELLVRARYNIFVSGGTGSGKTTFLNALSNFIPRDERIITIEDSAELQIKNIDNLVRLETRNAGPDGSGAITIKDLIKSALRMRPDRIVVGEVRGAEALDMLQAMNTGHDGSLSTGHANSTYDMLSRLETMVLQGAAGLPLEAIRQQIASAVDIIIHLSRLRDKSRKTMQIVEILGYDTATRTFRINPLYEFRESPQSTKEKVAGKLVRTEHPMQNVQKLENAGIYRTI